MASARIQPALFGPLEGSGYTIHYQEIIGHGGFGVVYKATNKYDVVVAVKMISKQTRMEAVKSMHLPNKHPNVIDVYDVLEDAENIYIFMELCAFGNLRSLFSKREFDIKQKLQMMKQIAEGIQHLHDNNIIHRDLKPENILVQSKGDGSPVIKLGDFGLSKFIAADENSTMSSNLGTTKFKAPEFWDRDKDGRLRYKRSVDIFAEGLTFLAMLQMDMPMEFNVSVEVEESFDADDKATPIGQIMYTRKKHKIPIPSTCIVRDDGSDLRGLIRDMLKVEPEDRPKADDVVIRLSSIQINMDL